MHTSHYSSQSAPDNMQLIPENIHSNKTVAHTSQNLMKKGN